MPAHLKICLESGGHQCSQFGEQDGEVCEVLSIVAPKQPSSNFAFARPV